MGARLFGRISPLSTGSYFVLVRHRGSGFGFPVRVRPRCRLGCVRGTGNTRHVIKSSVRRVRRRRLILIAGPRLRRT